MDCLKCLSGRQDPFTESRFGTMKNILCEEKYDHEKILSV